MRFAEFTSVENFDSISLVADTEFLPHHSTLAPAQPRSWSAFIVDISVIC